MRASPTRGTPFAVRPRAYSRRMRRLRRLTEAECYARCYGTRDDLVRVVAVDPARRDEAQSRTGDFLRRLLEERLEAHEEPEAA